MQKKDYLPQVYEPFQPIDATDELLEFNIRLENEEFFAKACSQFQLFGGKDAAEGTRKILTNLITHQLSLTMNWTGRNNKVGFCVMKKLHTLIHVCVRKNPMAQNATFSEVENTIKVWLRNAPDREGGMAKRANKENPKESQD
ncbi:hypothetical protein JTB14_013886 [Gonioctena quinquepunctata]|nr:hypothetical protein JTB14_013886 [Gonioctena quinquepunctata]